MADQFEANTEAIESYGEKFTEFRSQVDQLHGQISAAVVPDLAWGVTVGQIVSLVYRAFVDDLLNHCAMIEEGVDTIAERLKDTAKAYRDADTTNLAEFDKHLTELDQTNIPTPPAGRRGSW